MTFRRTKGIVTDTVSSVPENEADVIMTAVTLGLAGDYISTTGKPIQFDMDPLDAQDLNQREKTDLFNRTLGKMDNAVTAYLQKNGIAPEGVHAGLSPGYWQGAMIMGVYVLAGQEAPRLMPSDVVSPPLQAPVLSAKGKKLWDEIRTLSAATPQYTGRGAYTGFVDNKNDPPNDLPVGPCSTVRMIVPAPGVPAPTVVPHPRWLPPTASGLWGKRKRKGTDTFVPWGVIGGNFAANDPDPKEPNPGAASNGADQITYNLQHVYHMTFSGDVTNNDIAAYTHGMIQAIYSAYYLGPSCTPYEIAVGDVTKKMASCLPCTLFMHATGYPPTSIHLGSGESWTPLYAPYHPNIPARPHERAVIRDLNNAWYERCLEWLEIGLATLDDAHITVDHKASRDAVLNYLRANKQDPTVGGVLILDALTIHDTEIRRISRTLQ